MPISESELAEIVSRPGYSISPQNRPVANRKARQGNAAPGSFEPAQPQASLLGGGKKRKYRNEPTMVGDVLFDSKKEAARYVDLLQLERAGEIDTLTVKPEFVFIHNDVRIGKFTPDFQYFENGQKVVEDVKGGKATKTQAYRLRKKMLKAFFGLDVKET